ncbi:MAG: type IX secretion system protein PorQ, partial [Flavobacteriales bacterium]|nr:type IX secretion system protein PorQ [Flavobacteriales bacterium]
MRIKFISVLFLVALTLPSFAQLGGSSTYSFLDLTTSARNAAMGGDQISIKDGDLDLLYLNPAILDSSMNRYLATDFTNYYGGINYGYVGYAHTFNKVGNLAAGIMYANYGEFTRADVTGTIQGSFSANETLLHLTYARPFGKYFSTGANLKFIYSQLADYNSFGMALDLAAMFHHPKKNVTVSLVARNLGSQLKPFVKGQHEPLPISLDIGISHKLKYIPLRLSMTIVDLQKPDLTYHDPTNSPPDVDPLTGEPVEQKTNVGDAIMRHFIFSTELTIARRIFLRAGYNYGRRQELKVSTKPGTIGFSWGVGIKVHRFVFSYSRATYHLAGGTNHISISTNLGKHVKMKRRP